MLNEEEIINYCFPNKDTPVYACNVKNEMQPLNQNLIFYLSAEKIIKEISQDNDPIDKEDKKLNSHIMFHVFGYLFWECYYSGNFKIFFPKIFVFISQYPYFKFFSYLSQNIIYRIKNAINFEIPLEIQMYNIVNFTPSPLNYDLQLDLLTINDLLSIKEPKKPKKTFETIKKINVEKKKR